MWLNYKITVLFLLNGPFKDSGQIDQGITTWDSGFFTCFTLKFMCFTIKSYILAVCNVCYFRRAVIMQDINMY